MATTYNADGTIKQPTTGLISSAKPVLVNPEMTTSTAPARATAMPAGMSTTGATTANGYTPALGTATSGYDATKWNVDDEQTVQGRIAKVIADDSPLAQLDITQAEREMARRGLIHTSIGLGAAQEARYKYALPIATSDAATFSNAAQYNATGETAAAKYGADAINNQNLENIASTNTALSEGERNKTSAQIAASNAATSAATSRYNTDAQIRSNEADRTSRTAATAQTLSSSAHNTYTNRVDDIRKMDITPEAKTALLSEAEVDLRNHITLIEATSGLEISDLLWDDATTTTTPPPATTTPYKDPGARWRTALSQRTTG